MIDHNTLSLVKPKRLYEDKSCYISNNAIKIELGATCICAPFVSKLPSVEIKVKDLWTANLDAAISTSPIGYKIPDGKWNEIPISVADVTMFSSLSSVGEDTFFLSTFGINEKKELALDAIGFTWALEYRSPKVFPSGTSVFAPCMFDWYVFYYLFQMFKDLSGKKIGTLYWQQDYNNIYFTNEARQYFIVCNKNDSMLKFKMQYKDKILQTFSGSSSFPSSMMKKMLQLDSTSSEVKHLLRPFGDLVTVDIMDTHFKYSAANYVLYMTKDKK